MARVWAAGAAQTRAPRALGFEWTYLSGAACPARGEGPAAALPDGLVLPAADVGAMAPHREEIGRRVAPGADAVVVLDGAGWHGAKALAARISANLSLLPLPPYGLSSSLRTWQWTR